jgi:uncharacterized repeat protein (TIGR02543 family)
MKKFAILCLVVTVLLSACGKTTHTVTITYMPDGGQLAMDTPVESQKTTAQVNSESPQWYPPTPFKQGYTFVNWYLDAGFKDVYTHEALREKKELTLYARYIESEQDDVFVVSFLAHGGTFTPNQLVAKGNQLVKPPDPSLAGYKFQHWVYEVSESGKTGQVNFSQPVTENMVLGAEYSKN